jgi:hypothetical protein
MAVGASVKLPAVFAAFRGLQSMELYINYRPSTPAMLEEVGGVEFQEKVAQILSPTMNLAESLRGNIDVVFKLRVDVWHLLRGWERV